jgi:DNA-binding MarR family transcriptional regulator
MTDHPSPPLNDRFRAAYWKALQELDTLRLHQWEQSQLTMPQLRVLFQVRRSPGITTGHLSRNMGITMSTTSGLVGKLVDGGLVARSSSLDDRRQIPLQLTETGQQLAGELAEFTRPFLDGLAEELGQDIESVVTALETLIAAAARVRPR